MPDFAKNSTAVILGASGGIGNAFVQHLASTGKFSKIFTLSRKQHDQSPADDPAIVRIQITGYDDTSLQVAAQTIRDQTDDINFALAATGFLHDQTVRPEKSLGQINEAALHKLFAANTVVPIIFAKHFAKLMAKVQPAVLAAISARVGSISDNRLGGWYAYRASKSALNMLYKNLAIEMKRVNPNLIVSLLHPGTTDTALSRPFQANVADEKLFNPAKTAAYLYDVIRAMDNSGSGMFYGWDGKLIEW